MINDSEAQEALANKQSESDQKPARHTTSMASMQCHKPVEQSYNHVISEQTAETRYQAHSEQYSFTNKVKGMANSARKMFTEQHKHQEHNGNGGHHGVSGRPANNHAALQHENHATGDHATGHEQHKHQEHVGDGDHHGLPGHPAAENPAPVHRVNHATGHVQQSGHQGSQICATNTAGTKKKKKEAHGGNFIANIGEQMKHLKMKKNRKAGKSHGGRSDSSSSSSDDESDKETCGKKN